MAICLELPYPPSINHYFKRRGIRTFIGAEGMIFRKQVCIVLMAAKVRPMAGILAMKVRVYPPDRRKRDIDNIQKPLLDALEKGRAFFNDCQIKHLTIVMKEPIEGGKTIVTIRKISDTTSTISKTSS
jgi:crossover junction endodeoxyribonuclease RusA